jgi:hypothetical protein
MIVKHEFVLDNPQLRPLCSRITPPLTPPTGRGNKFLASFGDETSPKLAKTIFPAFKSLWGAAASGSVLPDAAAT